MVVYGHLLADLALAFKASEEHRGEIANRHPFCKGMALPIQQASGALTNPALLAAVHLYDAPCQREGTASNSPR